MKQVEACWSMWRE